MGQGVSCYKLNTSGGSKNNGQGELFKKCGNKFSDIKSWPPGLEEGKQGKHIQGHKNYVQGKSYLTISMKKAKELVKKFSGTGKVVGNSDTSNKEWVDFGKVIGIWIDKNGNEHPTTKGLIHHSKNGTHIVPSDPEGEY